MWIQINSIDKVEVYIPALVLGAGVFLGVSFLAFPILRSTKITAYICY